MKTRDELIDHIIKIFEWFEMPTEEIKNVRAVLQQSQDEQSVLGY